MTPDLFNRIAAELPTLHGWCDLDKAIDLAATVVALRPQVVVEIGVFGGKSLIPMALACQAIGSGVVIGVDPWDPRASSEGYDGKNKEWWENLDHESIARSYLNAVQRLGLNQFVQTVRMRSDAFAPPDKIDFCHIDGSHSEQAIRDVQRYASNVRVGGFTAMDDTTWTNNGIPHVTMAVDALLKLGFVHVYNVGTGAMFQRVSK